MKASFGSKAPALHISIDLSKDDAIFDNLSNHTSPSRSVLQHRTERRDPIRWTRPSINRTVSNSQDTTQSIKSMKTPMEMTESNRYSKQRVNKVNGARKHLMNVTRRASTSGRRGLDCNFMEFMRALEGWIEGEECRVRCINETNHGLKEYIKEMEDKVMVLNSQRMYSETELETLQSTLQSHYHKEDEERHRMTQQMDILQDQNVSLKGEVTVKDQQIEDLITINQLLKEEKENMETEQIVFLHEIQREIDEVDGNHKKVQYRLSEQRDQLKRQVQAMKERHDEEMEALKKQISSLENDKNHKIDALQMELDNLLLVNETEKQHHMALYPIITMQHQRKCVIIHAAVTGEMKMRLHAMEREMNEWKASANAQKAKDDKIIDGLLEELDTAVHRLEQSSMSTDADMAEIQNQNVTLCIELSAKSVENENTKKKVESLMVHIDEIQVSKQKALAKHKEYFMKRIHGLQTQVQSVRIQFHQSHELCTRLESALADNEVTKMTTINQLISERRGLQEELGVVRESMNELEERLDQAMNDKEYINVQSKEMNDLLRAQNISLQQIITKKERDERNLKAQLHGKDVELSVNKMELADVKEKLQRMLSSNAEQQTMLKQLKNDRDDVHQSTAISPITGKIAQISHQEFPAEEYTFELAQCLEAIDNLCAVNEELHTIAMDKKRELYHKIVSLEAASKGNKFQLQSMKAILAEKQTTLTVASGEREMDLIAARQRIKILETERRVMDNELKSMMSRYTENETTFTMILNQLQDGKECLHEEYVQRIRGLQRRNQSAIRIKAKLITDKRTLEHELTQHGEQMHVQEKQHQVARQNLQNRYESEIWQLSEQNENVRKELVSRIVELNLSRRKVVDGMESQREKFYDAMENLRGERQRLAHVNQHQEAKLNELKENHLETDGKLVSILEELKENELSFTIICGQFHSARDEMHEQYVQRIHLRDEQIQNLKITNQDLSAQNRIGDWQIECIQEQSQCLRQQLGKLIAHHDTVRMRMTQRIHELESRQTLLESEHAATAQEVQTLKHLNQDMTAQNRIGDWQIEQIEGQRQCLKQQLGELIFFYEYYDAERKQMVNHIAKMETQRISTESEMKYSIDTLKCKLTAQRLRQNVMFDEHQREWIKMESEKQELIMINDQLMDTNNTLRQQLRIKDESVHKNNEIINRMKAKEHSTADIIKQLQSDVICREDTIKSWRCRCHLYLEQNVKISDELRYELQHQTVSNKAKLQNLSLELNQAIEIRIEDIEHHHTMIVNQLQTETEGLESELALMKRSIIRLERQLEQTTADKEFIMIQYREVSEMNEDLNEQKVQLQRQVEVNTVEMTIQRMELDDARDKIQRLLILNKEQETDLKYAKGDIEGFLFERTERDEQLQSMKMQLSEMAEIKESYHKEINEMVPRILNLHLSKRHILQRAEEEHTLLMDDVETLAMTVNALKMEIDTKVTAKNEIINNLKRKCVFLEAAWMGKMMMENKRMKSEYADREEMLRLEVSKVNQQLFIEVLAKRQMADSLEKAKTQMLSDEIQIEQYATELERSLRTIRDLSSINEREQSTAAERTLEMEQQKHKIVSLEAAMTGGMKTTVLWQQQSMEKNQKLQCELQAARHSIAGLKNEKNEIYSQLTMLMQKFKTSELCFNTILDEYRCGKEDVHEEYVERIRNAKLRIQSIMEMNHKLTAQNVAFELEVAERDDKIHAQMVRHQIDKRDLQNRVQSEIQLLSAENARVHKEFVSRVLSLHISRKNAHNAIAEMVCQREDLLQQMEEMKSAMKEQDFVRIQLQSTNEALQSENDAFSSQKLNLSKLFETIDEVESGDKEQRVEVTKYRKLLETMQHCKSEMDRRLVAMRKHLEENDKSFHIMCGQLECAKDEIHEEYMSKMHSNDSKEEQIEILKKENNMLVEQARLLRDQIVGFNAEHNVIHAKRMQILQDMMKRKSVRTSTQISPPSSSLKSEGDNVPINVESLEFENVSGEQSELEQELVLMMDSNMEMQEQMERIQQDKRSLIVQLDEITKMNKMNKQLQAEWDDKLRCLQNEYQSLVERNTILKEERNDSNEEVQSLRKQLSENEKLFTVISGQVQSGKQSKDAIHEEYIKRIREKEMENVKVMAMNKTLTSEMEGMEEMEWMLTIKGDAVRTLTEQCLKYEEQTRKMNVEFTRQIEYIQQQRIERITMETEHSSKIQKLTSQNSGLEEMLSSLEQWIIDRVETLKNDIGIDGSRMLRHKRAMTRHLQSVVSTIQEMETQIKLKGDTMENAMSGLDEQIDGLQQLEIALRWTLDAKQTEETENMEQIKDQNKALCIELSAKCEENENMKKEKQSLLVHIDDIRASNQKSLRRLKIVKEQCMKWIYGMRGEIQSLKIQFHQSHDREVIATANINQLKAENGELQEELVFFQGQLDESSDEVKLLRKQLVENEKCFTVISGDFQSSKDGIHEEYMNRIRDKESENENLMALNGKLFSMNGELEERVEKWHKLTEIQEVTAQNMEAAMIELDHQNDVLQEREMVLKDEIIDKRIEMAYLEEKLYGAHKEYKSLMRMRIEGIIELNMAKKRIKIVTKERDLSGDQVKALQQQLDEQEDMFNVLSSDFRLEKDAIHKEYVDTIWDMELRNENLIAENQQLLADNKEFKERDVMLKEYVTKLHDATLQNENLIAENEQLTLDNTEFQKRDVMLKEYVSKLHDATLQNDNLIAIKEALTSENKEFQKQSQCLEYQMKQLKADGESERTWMLHRIEEIQFQHVSMETEHVTRIQGLFQREKQLNDQLESVKSDLSIKSNAVQILTGQCLKYEDRIAAMNGILLQNREQQTEMSKKYKQRTKSLVEQCTKLKQHLVETRTRLSFEVSAGKDTIHEIHEEYVNKIGDKEVENQNLKAMNEDLGEQVQSLADQIKKLKMDNQGERTWMLQRIEKIQFQRVSMETEHVNDVIEIRKLTAQNSVLNQMVHRVQSLESDIGHDGRQMLQREQVLVDKLEFVENTLEKTVQEIRAQQESLKSDANQAMEATMSGLQHQIVELQQHEKELREEVDGKQIKMKDLERKLQDEVENGKEDTRRIAGKYWENMKEIVSEIPFGVEFNIDVVEDEHAYFMAITTMTGNVSGWIETSKVKSAEMEKRIHELEKSEDSYQPEILRLQRIVEKKEQDLDDVYQREQAQLRRFKWRKKQMKETLSKKEHHIDVLQHKMRVWKSRAQENV